jgi:hypothetical protein
MALCPRSGRSGDVLHDLTSPQATAAGLQRSPLLQMQAGGAGFAD